MGDSGFCLAYHTLVANLTTLREECRFARTSNAIVARYEGLPFAALSFFGTNPKEIAGLASQLLGPDEAFYVLLNERQAALAKNAFRIEQEDPEWQMLFTGDLESLESEDAVPLGMKDLEQMNDLANETGLIAFEESPFERGPAFGIWDHDTLAAMGCTHLQTPHAAEIGNIATRTAHRRRGLARRIVSALVEAHLGNDMQVFLMVFQSNRPAIALYQSMGFEHLRPMFLLRCRSR